MFKLFIWIGYISLGIILIIFSAFMIIFLFGTDKTKQQNPKIEIQSISSTQTEIKSIALKDSLYHFSIKQLVDAYQANSVAADQSFKGKRFKISGIVDDINTDIAGNPYLILQGTPEFPYIKPQFKFSKKASPQLVNVEKGNTVTIACTGQGDILKTPVSADCLFQ